MTAKTLRSTKQFRLVYSEGKREAGEKVIVYFLRRESDGLRPGFVASRRIGKACRRNRAKRLMREIFRQLEHRMVAKDLWIIFIASFDPGMNSYREILEDVERSLGRAGLLSPNG